jgi:hypothetical protein
MKARKNPKYRFDEKTSVYFDEKVFIKKDVVPFGVEWGNKGLELTISSRKKVFEVDKENKQIILFWSLGPSLAHLLWQFHGVAPAYVNDFELVYLGKHIRYDEYERRSLGVTLGEWANKSFVVRELTQRTPERDVRGKEREHAFVEYRTTKTIEETRFFHVTAAKNLPSIQQRGLLPSRSHVLEQQEGWSPAWNFYLQRAVYLFTSPLRAIRLAYHLAEAGEEDIAILQVQGPWVRDTRLLWYDEDALFEEGMIALGNLDMDFPYWITSAEDSTRSIAYKGRIHPRFLSDYALVRWTPEVGEDYRTGKEIIEPAFEFDGNEEAQMFDDELSDNISIQEGYEIGPGLFSSP